MKILICFAIFATAIISCNNIQSSFDITSSKKLNIQDTWKWMEGITIEKNGSAITNYTKHKLFIKVINATHFSCMGHGRNKGKDSATAYYSSGGGRYELNDSNYTEHLEYCNAREWEVNNFHFTVSIHNDTLTSRGIEKVDNIGEQDKH